MSRPLSKSAKHRRQYLVMTVDPFFNIRKFFTRTGYKSLILKEFIQLYPHHDIHIFVLSSIIQHSK